MTPPRSHTPDAGTSALTAVAAAAGLILGALTAVGQGVLPDVVRSLSNSAGSWCLMAFVLAMMTARRVVAAVIGALTLAALLTGYVLAAAVRGDASSTSLILFWGLAAVLIGPILGLAGREVRQGTAMTAAAGVGAMSGVLVGEGVYGLSYLGESTLPAYWWGSIGVGIGLLLVVAVRRLQRPRPTGAAVLTTAAVAAAFVALAGGDLIALFR
jgi:Family of unknown function (DUF6518)